MKELLAKIEVVYLHQDERLSRTIWEFRVNGLGYHLIAENNEQTLIQGHSRSYQWSDDYQPVDPLLRPYRCVFTNQPYQPVPLFPPVDEEEEERNPYEVKNWSGFRLHLLHEALLQNTTIFST